MKVKIGNKIYSPEDAPILLMLTDQDKKNIGNMPKEYYKYCVYDTGKLTEEEILEWMKKDN